MKDLPGKVTCVYTVPTIDTSQYIQAILGSTINASGDHKDLGDSTASFAELLTIVYVNHLLCMKQMKWPPPTRHDPRMFVIKVTPPNKYRQGSYYVYEGIGLKKHPTAEIIKICILRGSR